MEGVFDVLFDGVKEEKAREPKYILGSPKLKGSDDILTEFPDRALEALSLLFHAFKKHCGYITLFPENRFNAVNLSKEIRTADAKLLFVLLPRVLPPEDLLKKFSQIFVLRNKSDGSFDGSVFAVDTPLHPHNPDPLVNLLVKKLAILLEEIIG